MPDSDSLDFGLPAYILVGADTDGENFVAVHFDEGANAKIAELLYLFNSGSLMDECMMSLRTICKDELEFAAILQTAIEQLKEHYEQAMVPQQEQSQLQPYASAPVVDPCNVFKTGGSSELPQ